RGMKRTTLLTAGILTFAILLTGCSGASGPSPQERMEQAQATIENAEAITMSLTGTDLPSNVDGIQAATGTGVIEGDLIKFEGEFQGKVSGIAATVAILAIGDDTYMKLFTPSYEPVDLGTLGVPNPIVFFAPDTGIASLIAATTNLAAADDVREGEEILAQITGTLDGEHIQSLLRIGEPGQTFNVTFGLTDQNELRRAELQGEFWEGTTSTYTLLLTDYGQVVPIEAPTS
ncbi:MAG TPA: LppX_LprAFG lipoprotein, partial [Terrimesophilobacter sp.]|nr:LppX_LprAFG lipoprotein [Terrimesophilobacter sp.]